MTDVVSDDDFDVYEVNAYWKPRQEGAASCAQRLARMAVALSAIHPAFGRWYYRSKVGRRKSDTLLWPMQPPFDGMTNFVETGRFFADQPRVPMPELGYSFAAWNGRDDAYAAFFRIHAGSYTRSRVFPNTADLHLSSIGPTNSDLMCEAALKPAMQAIAEAWDSDWAVVSSRSYTSRLFTSRGPRHLPFRSGWMTYLSAPYAGRIVPPPSAIVETVPGGGLLMLATKEPFATDNQAHLAVANAIEAALAPLQSSD